MARRWREVALKPKLRVVRISAAGYEGFETVDAGQAVQHPEVNQEIHSDEQIPIR